MYFKKSNSMEKHTSCQQVQIKGECDVDDVAKKIALPRRRSSLQRNLEILQQRFQHVHAVPTTKRQLQCNRRLSTAIMEKTQFQAKSVFSLGDNGPFTNNTTEFSKNTSQNFVQDLRNDYVLPAQQGDEAISNNELYSDQNILKRESLKFDKGIRDVLGKLWSLVDKDKDNTISKDEYYQLHRRLLRALVGKVSNEEEIVMCDEDWTQDIGNVQHKSKRSETLAVHKGGALAHIKVMSRGQFINAFFRMVDLWTEKVCVNEYFTFLSDAFHRISTPDGKGRYKFRDMDKIKRRSRRASMIVIDGKVFQAGASSESEAKKNVGKKNKAGKRDDKEGWWCRLYGTGPWWRRLKGGDEQKNSQSTFLYKCSDITFASNNRDKINTKRLVPFQRQPYRIHANSLSTKTMQVTQNYCRKSTACQIATHAKPGQKLRQNPKLSLSLPDFHHHANTSVEQEQAIDDNINVAVHAQTNSEPLEFCSRSTSCPTTLTQASHLPLTENKQPESKDGKDDLNAQKECTKVCGGKHEMKWILERNYRDDWYTHMQTSQKSFSFGFFLAGDRRPKYLGGGTNHQPLMIPADNCRTRTGSSADLNTFMHTIYTTRKQNPGLSLAALFERASLTKAPQQQEPTTLNDEDKILTMKLPTSGNINIAAIRAKSRRNDIFRNQKVNTKTNKKRKSVKKLKKRRNKQFLRIQGTQPGYTNMVNKFSRKPILRFRRLNRPLSSPYSGSCNRTL